VKLLNVAGAYWRGDEKNKCSHAFTHHVPKQKGTGRYFSYLMEAKKRRPPETRKELELFAFSEKVGNGVTVMVPKGTVRVTLEHSCAKAQIKPDNDPVVTTAHWQQAIVRYLGAL